MNARCPLTVVEWEYPVDDEEAERLGKQPLPPRACDGELHLIWRLDIPLEAGDVVDGPEQAAKDRCTDAWEVVCENGHTLARSSGEETAEPFQWTTVFPSMGVEGRRAT